MSFWGTPATPQSRIRGQSIEAGVPVNHRCVGVAVPVNRLIFEPVHYPIFILLFLSHSRQFNLHLRVKWLKRSGPEQNSQKGIRLHEIIHIVRISLGAAPEDCMRRLGVYKHHSVSPDSRHGTGCHS